MGVCDKYPCRFATAASGPIDQSAKAISRYQTGYRLAKSISGLSQICKGVGVLAGILAIVFGVIGSETLMRPNASMVGMASVQAQHNVYLVSVILFGGLVACAVGSSGWRWTDTVSTFRLLWTPQ